MRREVLSRVAMKEGSHPRRCSYLGQSAAMTGQGRRSQTTAERATMQMMVDRGESNGAIASVLGRGRSTVADVAKLVRVGPSTPKKDYRGRPWLMSDWKIRQLKRDFDGTRFFSVASSTEHVNKVRAMATTIPKPTAVPSWVVHWALRRLGFTSFTPVKRPFYAARNMEKRLEWANTRAHWMAEQSLFFFTDESTHDVRGTPGTASRPSASARHSGAAHSR